eukprot:3462495-Prymnesium_polylepis.1
MVVSLLEHCVIRCATEYSARITGLYSALALGHGAWRAMLETDVEAGVCPGGEKCQNQRSLRKVVSLPQDFANKRCALETRDGSSPVCAFTQSPAQLNDG